MSGWSGEQIAGVPPLAAGARYALVCAVRDIRSASELVGDEGVYQPPEAGDEATARFRRPDGTVVAYHSDRYPMLIAWVDLGDPA